MKQVPDYRTSLFLSKTEKGIPGDGQIVMEYTSHDD
jgi:hypothetical protein